MMKNEKFLEVVFRDYIIIFFILGKLYISSESKRLGRNLLNFLLSRERGVRGF